MTHSLPDDVSKWPASPYELLGVHHHADTKEIKRAYARLIRTYKPDFHPTEFHRIRSAYESVIGTTKKRVSRPFQPQRSANFRQRTEHDPDRSRSRSRTRLESESTALDLRELAEDETMADRYRKLCKRIDEGRSSARVFEQLYWILKIDPQVDPSSNRWDYLTKGISRHASSQKLLDLCLLELKWNPNEAMSPRWNDIIFSTHPMGFKRILQIRWEEAAKQEHWSLITQDVHVLRSNRTADQREWSMLLAMATRGLIWSTNQARKSEIDALRAELNDLWSMRLVDEDDLDALDIVAELKIAIAALRRQDPHPLWDALCDSIRVVWKSPRSHHAELEKLGRIIAKDADRFYNMIVEPANRFAELQVALDLVTENLRLLTDKFARRPNAATTRYVLGCVFRNLRRLRPALIEICQQERLMPDQIADMIEQDAGQTLDIVTMIRDDAPLNIVCLSELLYRRS